MVIYVVGFCGFMLVLFKAGVFISLGPSAQIRLNVIWGLLGAKYEAYCFSPSLALVFSSTF